MRLTAKLRVLDGRDTLSGIRCVSRDCRWGACGAENAGQLAKETNARCPFSVEWILWDKKNGAELATEIRFSRYGNHTHGDYETAE